MATERTHEVDIIRLFALLGICIVNISMMGIFDGETPIVPHNQYADFFRALVFEGKFLLLFAFIFGWGIATQEKKITEAGYHFKHYYFSRAFGLILLGAFHLAFVFSGDILITYGLASIIFWYLRDYVLRTPVKRFITTMISLTYLAIILFAIIGFGLVAIIEIDDVENILPSNQALGGSFYEATLYRLKEGAFILFLSSTLSIFLDLAAFGLGYMAARSDFFDKNNEGFLKLQKLLPWLLVIGITFNLPYAFLVSGITSNLWAGAGFLLWFIGAPALSAVYLYLIVIVARRIQIPEIFVLAGRNSLSVYLLQGIIASFMFGGYGLGWFNQFGELALIPLSIGIYLSTVIITGFYAQKFGRGFFEPILRKLIIKKRIS